MKQDMYLLFTLKSRNIDDVFESIYTTITSNIQKAFRKGSGRVTRHYQKN